MTHVPPTDNWASADSSVRVLYQQILEAWNRRDAQGMASFFAEDGNLVGFDGSQADGRDEIAGHLAPIFANHPTAAYAAKVREVRLIGRNAALLRAVAGMVPPGASDLNPALNTIHTLIAAHRAPDWKAALFQSTPAAFHGRPHLSEQLTNELREVRCRGLICG